MGGVGNIVRKSEILHKFESVDTQLIRNLIRN